mmetsp:Transcript_124504/g.302285  ORF Transcript_124504/g.302285 Transcript_124504/m.302285 type:complete len:200 (+) Transcript_124504:1-600(+)
MRCAFLSAWLALSCSSASGILTCSSSSTLRRVTRCLKRPASVVRIPPRRTWPTTKRLSAPPALTTSCRHRCTPWHAATASARTAGKGTSRRVSRKALCAWTPSPAPRTIALNSWTSARGKSSPTTRRTPRSTAFFCALSSLWIRTCCGARTRVDVSALSSTLAPAPTCSAPVATGSASTAGSRPTRRRVVMSTPCGRTL